MGGKASAPAAPDYVGATQLQGQLSKENLNMQNYANRPTINRFLFMVCPKSKGF